jgi:hypothetical protein
MLHYTSQLEREATRPRNPRTDRPAHSHADCSAQAEKQVNRPPRHPASHFANSEG